MTSRSAATDLRPAGLRDVARRSLKRAADAAQIALARGAMHLPSAWAVKLAGGAPRGAHGLTLDPQAQLALWLAERIPRPKNGDVAVERRQLELDAKLLAPVAPPMAHVRDLVAAAVPIRLYVPRSRASHDRSPALVYYHGGGFVLGSLDSHDAVCRALAFLADVKVVAVDYRLAPEHRFPAGVEDAVSAFEWVAAHADELGVNPDKLAVGGDSAGGNFAAVVCHETKRAGGPTPAFQLLVYPATDLHRSMPSHQLFRQGFFLDWATTSWFLEHYLRSPADADDPRGSPCRYDDFAGQPPAFVLTAGFDPLRDEGEAYAEQLRAAGVPVKLRREPGMFHGFFSASGGMHVARRALNESALALREGLR